jgi:cytidylate kinase
MTSTRVVTVSATYGAGGTVIAPAVAERLGIPFADRLIPLQGATGPSGEAVNAAELAGEPRSAFSEALASLAASWITPVPSDVGELPDQVRTQVESSIQDLVGRGGAVILGRAAAVVLADDPRAFHVRLDGPVDRRAARGAEYERCDLATARRHLDASDAARVRYVKRLYRRDPSEPTLYHLTLDATVFSVATCTDLVVTAAEAFWEHRAASA